MKFEKLLLSLTLSTLVFSAGCTSMGGESAMLIGGSEASNSQQSNVNDDLANALARVEMAQAEAESARAEAAAAKAALKFASTGTASMAGNELFPPNPLAGHCYARVLIPATFNEKTEQLLVKAESMRLEITPAETEWTTEQILVREASSRIEAVPAEFKTVTEQVLVKPKTTELVSIPAQYEETSKQVVDVPAHTEWKQGSNYINVALEAKMDSSTGEVMCLIEVPTSYKTVTHTVQITPPSTQEIVTPAEYKTVTKTVVAVPATTRKIDVPAQYNTIRKLKIITPAASQEVIIPAEYKTVSKQVKSSEEVLEWREVLCDVNMTRELVTELQRKLHKAGYFDSPVDGIYQQLTQNGVNRYAENGGLPFGSNYIALEVADALELAY